LNPPITNSCRRLNLTFTHDVLRLPGSCNDRRRFAMMLSRWSYRTARSIVTPFPAMDRSAEPECP
jgi:hypothetical protein